jgi:hypothetical protein
MWERASDSPQPASFSKLVSVIFPGIQTRRLGVRAESKYHYVDLRTQAPNHRKSSQVLSITQSLQRFDKAVSSWSFIHSPPRDRVGSAGSLKLKSTSSPPVLFPFSGPPSDRELKCLSLCRSRLISCRNNRELLARHFTMNVAQVGEHELTTGPLSILQTAVRSETQVLKIMSFSPHLIPKQQKAPCTCQGLWKTLQHDST